MIAGPPAMRKTHGRIKTIVGMVSMTGSRAARASNLVSASCRISADKVLSAEVSGVPYLHGLDQRGAQALVAFDACPGAQIDQCDPASETMWSSLAVCASSWATSRWAALQFGGDPYDGGAEGEACLGADHHHIQGIRQTEHPIGPGSAGAASRRSNPAPSVRPRPPTGGGQVAGRAPADRRCATCIQASDGKPAISRSLAPMYTARPFAPCSPDVASVFSSSVRVPADSSRCAE